VPAHNARRLTGTDTYGIEIQTVDRLQTAIAEL
jgi:hypothetical protein